MTDTISPACGTYLGAPQACDVEAVALIEAGERYNAQPVETSTPTPAVLALVVALGVSCVLLSFPSRRNGRRDTYRKGH